jgi:hypothetical protein
MNDTNLPGDQARHAIGERRPGSSSALEVLATALVIRLAPGDLEWLARVLTERAEQHRREDVRERR